jgi:hypothetical protein
MKPSQIDCESLANWFEGMKQPLDDARHGAFHCDPWAVAGLGRDEVRNSAVLAWLLNPRGSHGLGVSALHGLLQELEHFDCKFPTTTGRYCNVRVEVNPDGELGNRVDIELDAENFYLIIEAKINAPEGDKQLSKYGDLALQRARNRPWALVFLTPDGRQSESADKHIAKVLPLSWDKISYAVEQSVKSSFRADSRTKGASRQMAEKAVQRFLKRVRCF